MEELEDPFGLFKDEDDDDSSDVMELPQSPTVDFSSLDALFLPNDEPEESEECIDTDFKTSVDILPIVYTTKLDDMKIFKTNLEADSIKDITNKIILESKPKVRRLAKYKIEKSYKSYKNMTKKLNAINQRLRLKTDQRQKYVYPNLGTDITLAVRIRNIELLKMCKPVSIILEDIKHTLPFLIGSSQKHIQRSSGDGNCIVLSEDDEPLCKVESNDEGNFLVLPKNEPQILSKQSSNKNNREITYTSLKENLKNVVFLFYNKSICELDIYHIDGNAIVAEHNTLKGSIESFDDNTLYPYVGQKEVIKLEFCCWYKREEFIKLMWPKMITLSISRFMRKSHPCIPGKCVCCCVKSNNKSGSNTAITRRVMPLAPKNNSSNVEVENAYFKFVKPIENDDIEVLEQKISHTLFEMHEKIASSDAMQEEDASKETGKEINENLWYKHLLSTSFTPSLIDRALRYTRKKEKMVRMREWSFEPSILMKIGNIKNNDVDCYELGKYGEVIAYSKQNGNVCPIHGDTKATFSCIDLCCWQKREKVIANLSGGDKGYNDAVLNFMRRPHKCLPGCCRCCCRKVNPQTETRLPFISLPISEHNKRFPFKTTANTTTATQNIHVTSCIPKPIMTTPIPKPIAIIPTLRSGLPNAPILEKVLTQSPLTPSPVISQTLEVDSMINTILNRFKDVRLSITEDGKVSAALNTPVNTLNSAELKVLSQILTHAQEQVKALGLRPGANLTNIANSASQNREQIKPMVRATGTISITTSITNSDSQSTDRNKVSDVSFHSLGTKSLPAELPKVAPRNSSDVFRVTHQDPPPLLVNKAANPYDCYSKLMGIKSQAYSKSLKSYIKATAECENMSTPIIENVFSLSNTDYKVNPLTDENVETAVSCDQSSTKSNTEIMSSRRNKRKSIDKDGPTQTKIRVKSPAKLGIGNDHDDLQTHSSSKLDQHKIVSVDTISNKQQIVIQEPVSNPITTPSVAMITVCGGTIQLIPRPVQATAGQLNLIPQPTQINTGNLIFQKFVQTNVSNVQRVQQSDNISLDAQTDCSTLVEQTDFEDQEIPGFLIMKPDDISSVPRPAPIKLQPKIDQPPIYQISPQNASVVTAPVLNNAVQTVDVLNSSTNVKSSLLQQLVQKPALGPHLRKIAPKLSKSMINMSTNTMTTMNSDIPTLVIEIDDDDDDDNTVKNETDDLFGVEQNPVMVQNEINTLTLDAQDITSENTEDNRLAEGSIEESQVIEAIADILQDPLNEDQNEIPEEGTFVADIQFSSGDNDADDEEQCILGF